MKYRRKMVRGGMIAVAGIVLLMTAVPQVASGIGLSALANRLDSATSCSSGSGSSGSGSSGSCCSGGSGSASGSGSGSGQCVTGPGTVTGTVTVTGAPKNFVPPFSGAGACPDTGPSSVTTLCADPDYALADNGSYTLTLDPGTWVIDGFYEINGFGGAFLGAPQVVTVTSGGTLVLDTTVPYAKPATLKATVTVSGLPSGVTVQDTTVLLCPSGAPYSGGVQPLTCVNGDSYGVGVTTADSVVISGLPSGPWTAYPGYCTVFGCATNAQAGVPVVLTAGATTRVKLKTAFLPPPDGIVNASVTVSGAPAGFADQVEVTACQVQSLLTDCQSYGGSAGTPFPMELGTGVWEFNGAYLAPVFGNAITGPTELVNVVGGQTISLTLDVPYQVLGTAAGAIKVSGLPGGVRVTSYTVQACPVGGTAFITFPFESCVEEYSGPGSVTYGAADTRRLGKAAHRVTVPRAAGSRINAYNLPTLTPGQWLLNVSYTTEFGSFFAPASTLVTINSGQTTTTRLTAPYQPPTLGAVTGGISVVGAPAYNYQAGARACSSAPTAGTCTDEVDAYLGSTSKYVLDLTPGTWWVQGVVYVYGPTSTQEVTSAPRQVTVSVGTKTRASFTVPVS